MRKIRNEASSCVLGPSPELFAFTISLSPPVAQVVGTQERNKRNPTPKSAFTMQGRRTPSENIVDVHWSLGESFGVR